MSENAAEHAFSGYLAYVVEPLFHIYSKHLDEWSGEFFPYLWMGEVAKVIVDNLVSKQEKIEILSVLDYQLGQGSDGAKNLIGVGFIESLPIPIEGGGDIVAEYTNLKDQYLIVFGN